ncbi:hypothetical protein SRHO_G00002590 [Serrasalmus rhombeus]
MKSFLLTVIEMLGTEAALTAEEKLKKKAQSASVSPPGQTTTPTNLAASSENPAQSTEALHNVEILRKF